MQGESSATVGTSTAILQELEKARRLLLETGTGNNSLISHKLSTTKSARGLEITGWSSKEMLRALVVELREMPFEALLPEDGSSKPIALPPAAGAAVDGADDAGETPGENGKSDALLVNYTPKEARGRLLRTRQEARSEAEDKGFNFLHLALGMLKWFNKDEKEPRRAPLVLVPVALEKSNKGEGYVLRYTEEGLQENLPILVKVEEEFDLKLPRLPEGTEKLDLGGYFDGIEEAIRERQSNWAVERDAVILDLFKFNRLPMYKDLDDDRWPRGLKLIDHPVIHDFLEDAVRSGRGVYGMEETGKDDGSEKTSAAAAGASSNGEGPVEAVETPRPAWENGASLDEVLNPREIRPVVEADSSQLAALLHVRGGEDLVIQGPPGTGKSQTITNIVADAVGRGLSVLFVAEKMAALDVVHRRLESVGLGDACLVLHSVDAKGIKKSLLDELNRTLGLEETDLPREGSDIRALETERDRLNAYCAVVNEPIGESEVSPHHAIGELVRRGRQGKRAPSLLDQAEARQWSWQEFLDKRRIVDDLQEVLKNQVLGDGVDRPQEHPFFGTSLDHQPNKWDMETSCSRAIKPTRELAARVGELARSLTPEPEASERGDRDPESLCRVARLVDRAPDLGGVSLDIGEWRARGEGARAYAEAGLRLAELKKTHEHVLIPEAWDEDLRGIRQHLANPRGGLLGLGRSQEYKEARSRLAGLCCGPVPKNPEDQVALVDVLLEARRLSETLDRNAEAGTKLLGGPAGEPGEWSSRVQAADWALEVRGAVEDDWFPEEFFGPALREARDLEARAASVEATLEEQRDASARVLEILEMEEIAKRAFLERSLFEQGRWFGTWRDGFGDLAKYANFNRLLEDCREAGLDRVAAQAVEWDGAAEGLVGAFEYAWYDSLYWRAYEEREEIRRFARATHEKTLQRFREADGRVLEHNKAYLKRRHREQVWQVRGRPDLEQQLNNLKREVQKKTRHKPIRRLMLEAGDVVRGAKPVIMMSPQSVANFLDPEDRRRFDLVVFDEASQIEPVDAFGAIARGRQVVVVGDQRQMPPTSFFGGKGTGTDDDSTAKDLESILGLLLARGKPDRMLSWHYRSEHESLIEVSNERFYNNDLTVFPSPFKGSTEAGLRHHPLDHSEAPYEPSGEGSKKAVNPGEAQAVAREVMKHAQREMQRKQEAEEKGEKYKAQTLMVVAFSTAQRDEIEKQVNQRGKSNEHFKNFENDKDHKAKREGFVVKNLENVQGDERDVIFISIGYGRSRDHKLHLGFGPVNQDGGERRLNVLITRARKACHVFTNLNSSDLPSKEGTSLGVRGLGEFLRRAEEREKFLNNIKEAGEEGTPREDGGGEITPFEDAVAGVLREHDYAAERRVGSKKLYVDLAVLDPEDLGRYLVGVQLDGPGYGSARSARDRDVVRQAVLAGKYGWSLHQIWSPDWYANPEEETERLLAAVEAARQEARKEREQARQTARPERETSGQTMEEVTPEPDEPPVADEPVSTTRPEEPDEQPTAGEAGVEASPGREEEFETRPADEEPDARQPDSDEAAARDETNGSDGMNEAPGYEAHPPQVEPEVTAEERSVSEAEAGSEGLAVPETSSEDEASQHPTEPVEQPPVSAAPESVPAETPARPDGDSSKGPQPPPGKKLTVVAQLLEANAIPPGTVLALNSSAFTREQRRILGGVLRQDPLVGRARWTGKTSGQAIEWLKDGGEYSVTKPVLEILYQQGFKVKAVQGPKYWTVPDGRTLVEVAATVQPPKADGSATADERPAPETRTDAAAPRLTSENDARPPELEREPAATEDGAEAATHQPSMQDAETRVRSGLYGERVRAQVSPYRLASPNVKRGDNLSQADPNWFVERVVEVVDEEGPVHHKEIARRLANAAGKKSPDKQAQSAVREACEEAARRGLVEKREFVFFWAPGITEPPLRDRSELPGGSKKLSLVALEEIGAAIEAAVRGSGGVRREEAIERALGILGLGEAGGAALERPGKAFAALVRQNRLREHGDGWEVAER